MPHQHFILPLTCATPNSTSAILKHILIPTPKLSRPLYTLFPVLARNSRVFDFSHLKEKHLAMHIFANCMSGQEFYYRQLKSLTSLPTPLLVQERLSKSRTLRSLQ